MERLITSKSDPVFGAVYIRLQALRKMVNGNLVLRFLRPLKKLQIQVLKGVYRVYNEKVAIADLMTLLREVPDTEEPYRYINP